MDLPSGICERQVNIPIENIWRFVSDMNNWAPLVPGYQEHRIINMKQSIWICKGDLGIIQKTVRLSIWITEWKRPTKVAFTLSSGNEQVMGNGYFQAVKISKDNTKMIGSLTITAKGIKGTMINSVLRPFIPKATADLTDAVIRQIQKKETVVMH